jgi:rhodanese-related sulfurtransferase
MKKLNAEGPPVLGAELPGQKRFTAKEVHERLCEHCLVVDVRSKEAFAAAHVPGSINIPLGPSLPTWAGWVLPYDKKLLIIPSQPADVPGVVTHLIRVGLDQIGGYLEDGLDAWESHGFEIAQLDSLSVHALATRCAAQTPPFVLDVRTGSEMGWRTSRDGPPHPRRPAPGARRRGPDRGVRSPSSAGRGTAAPSPRRSSKAAATATSPTFWRHECVESGGAAVA